MSQVLEGLHETPANCTLLLVFVHIGGVVVKNWLHDEHLIRSTINDRKQASQEP